MINEAITGLLLLSVAIMTNFLGTTLNCQLQKLLKNSPIYKNLAIIFLIYFTINFSSSKGTYPLKLWVYVIFVYILFILLMNQNQQFLTVNLILLFFIYTQIQFRDYYNGLLDIISVNSVNSRIHVLQIVFGITLITGFILYIKPQIQEHRLDFNWLNFLFGINTCTSEDKHRHEI